jgi:hypothetical protein
MSLPREEAAVKPESLFGDVPAVVVGGVAARAYAPERQTKDIDFLVDHKRLSEAIDSLGRQGWRKKLDHVFPNAALGLHGEAWEKDGLLIDVIATSQEWARDALRRPTYQKRRKAQSFRAGYKPPTGRLLATRASSGSR